MPEWLPWQTEQKSATCFMNKDEASDSGMVIMLACACAGCVVLDLCGLPDIALDVALVGCAMSVFCFILSLVNKF